MSLPFLTVPSSGMCFGRLGLWISYVWALPSVVWHQSYNMTTAPISPSHSSTLQEFFLHIKQDWQRDLSVLSSGIPFTSPGREVLHGCIHTRSLWEAETFYTDKNSPTGLQSADTSGNIFPKSLDDHSFFFPHHLEDR